MISDRRSRKKVLMIGYGAQTLIAAGLVTADLTGTLTLPLIFSGALLVGIFATITTPSVLVILKDFIKNDDLFGRLAGLAAANTKIGQLVASAGFGLLYGLIAATGTLLLSGVMALISFVGISGIKIVSEEHPKLAPGQTVLGFLVDGRRYIFRHRAMALLVMLTAVPMAARGMVLYQLPAIVDKQFNSGHLTMGLLYAVGVVGGLLGGFILSAARARGDHPLVDRRLRRDVRCTDWNLLFHPCRVLSGDSPRTTAAIATELALTDAEGGRMPIEKAERIRQWQAAGEPVGMVGDGINDAPALAQADLSIAMASGADIAGQTSDLVLARPNLTLVPWFVGLSRRTRRIIRENLIWAFGYNLLTVRLAATGTITPIIAAGTMALSSLLVVADSLRLRR
ncbi:MAG: HAD-IC family P-type ATPase [Hyphomicrobiales bacterium]|nr:HAD-IC family P-type ATPase [Hyphomicrobiales bacterium]